MDRALAHGLVVRRRLGQAGVATGAIAVAGLAWVALPALLRPSVQRARIRTAVVERGPVEAVLEASGTVLPAFEKLLSSPDDARVLRILRRPGDTVRPGDEILELDVSGTRLELERAVEQIAQKQSEREELGLALEQQVSDYEGRLESSRLDAELLRYRLEQQRKMHADGLTSEEALRQAEVELRKAELDLVQLAGSIVNARKTTAARLGRLALELRVLEKERDEARHRATLAETRSDRDGVLTWVVPEEGAALRRGDVTARIADLGSFRVEATVSDVHADRLAAGLPVRVRIGERFLDARIAGVRPAIESGVARFDVTLEQPSDPALRQNLRVDVLVVTGRRDDTLRLRRGPYAGPGGRQPVFVVRGDRAWRTEAVFGLSGYEHHEVLEGLASGDEVILSSMEDYLHLESLAVR